VLLKACLGFLATWHQWCEHVGFKFLQWSSSEKCRQVRVAQR